MGVTRYVTYHMLGVTRYVTYHMLGVTRCVTYHMLGITRCVTYHMLGVHLARSEYHRGIGWLVVCLPCPMASMALPGTLPITCWAFTLPALNTIEA